MVISPNPPLLTPKSSQRGRSRPWPLPRTLDHRDVVMVLITLRRLLQNLTLLCQDSRLPLLMAAPAAPSQPLVLRYTHDPCQKLVLVLQLDPGNVAQRQGTSSPRGAGFGCAIPSVVAARRWTQGGRSEAPKVLSATDSKWPLASLHVQKTNRFMTSSEFVNTLVCERVTNKFIQKRVG